MYLRRDLALAPLAEVEAVPSVLQEQVLEEAFLVVGAVWAHLVAAIWGALLLMAIQELFLLMATLLRCKEQAQQVNTDRTRRPATLRMPILDTKRQTKDNARKIVRNLQWAALAASKLVSSVSSNSSRHSSSNNNHNNTWHHPRAELQRDFLQVVGLAG